MGTPDDSCPPHSVVVFNKATETQLNAIEAEMQAPRGVVVDNKGFIYVADSRNYRIVKFHKNDSNPTPRNLDLAPQRAEENDVCPYLYGMCIVKRKIYVADQKNGCIQVLNLELQQQGSFNNTRDGQLRGPNGIAFDTENKCFYVACEHHVVEKFDEDFKPVKTIKSIKGAEKEIKFDKLKDIAVSSKKGLIFVTEPCNNRILCFNTKEECVNIADKCKHCKFINPQVVALDPDDDHLYVGDESGYLHCIKL